MSEKIFWHNISQDEAIRSLGSDPVFGLKNSEVVLRSRKHGKNLIPEKKKTSQVFLFLKHFNSPLIYLIFTASVLSLILGKIFDAVFILIVVLITGIAAYFQERNVSKILEELKKITKVKATIIREGKKMEIDSQELVVGDIVLLDAGDKSPADVRLIESQDLEVNEMALTGEWLPSKKHTKTLSVETVLADRENMVYTGTIIENGKGKAVVTEIGEKTEMGKISLALQKVKENKTLLEKRIAGFSKYYGAFVALLLVLAFIFGILRKMPRSDLIIILIATGVSAIPEGLLPAITIILVIGMKRILQKRGLTRKLSTLETLGSVQIILSDKTATLTEGRMRVVKILTGQEMIGRLSEKSAQNHNLALEISTLVSDAFIENPEEAMKKWIIRGKPTDKALFISAIESGLDVESLRKETIKIGELLFSSQRKYHAVLFQKKIDKILYIVGAPEIILEYSKFLRIGENEESLRKNKAAAIYLKLHELSGKGFRVLGLGYKKIRNVKQGENIENLMSRLIFVGVVVLQDPLRKEAKEAIKICQKMGIKPVIVSGDHLLTTKAIAQELGLKTEKENVVEAKELDKLSDKELSERIDRINVFARIDPHHKLRIVDMWQNKGKVVAMTGDGINDAPALRKADVGLALGSGTDLAKEASDLVLLNDNFSTIINAIEEGRSIFDKVRNIISYLVSVNFTEMGFILISILFGFPLPLLATQILWINIVEGGFPAISLTLEKRDKEVVIEKPRPKKESVFNRSTKLWMFSIGFITVIVELIFFWTYLKFGVSLEKARTFLFAATTIEAFYLAFSHRSLRKEIFRKDIFSNLYLNIAVVLGVILMLLGIYMPIFNKFLHTVVLNYFDWLFVVLCVFLELIILERIKKRLFKTSRGEFLAYRPS